VLKELLEIETQGWRALSSEMEVAREFYACTLSEDAVMLFPGGMVLEGKEQILASLGAQPWKTFQIKDARVVRVSEGAAILFYRVTAQREKGIEYSALISSAYQKTDGGWLLWFHQHTPI
jgi:hypothetical protein